MSKLFSENRLKLYLLIAAVVIILLTFARLFFAYSNGSMLSHVSGVWMVLASDLADGVFYRPLYSESIGYGGTRFFPLYFSLHALLILIVKSNLIAGFALSFISAIFLIIGVYFLLKRLELEKAMAAVFSIFILCGFIIQVGLANMKGDILPMAFIIWGFYFALKIEKSWRQVIICSILLGLAFATKVTAGYGFGVVFFWLLLNGKPKQAIRFGAISTVVLVAALFGINTLSDGRFLEIMKICLSGGTSLQSILRSPSNIIVGLSPFHRVEIIFVIWALAILVNSIRHLRFSLPAIFFTLTIIVTIIIFSSPGTGPNHFIDIFIASIVLVGSFWPKIKKRRLGLTALNITAIVGISIIIIIAFRFDMPNDNFSKVKQIIEQTGTSKGDLLSEDPLIPVLAGERARLMDPFMYRLVRTEKPEYETLLLDRIARKEFRALIFRSNPKIKNSYHYAKVHYGLMVIRSALANYHFSATVGGYYIYLPNQAKEIGGE